MNIPAQAKLERGTRLEILLYSAHRFLYRDYVVFDRGGMACS
jgi:hypothetical protein